MCPEVANVMMYVRYWIGRLLRPVRREGAETYLLVMLISFAATVILTRWFLQIAGYPEIGGGEFHIAHVLFGGLFLFIGSLIPVVLSGRAVYPFAAALAGIGVGLFIDEVGKFITTRNDYFHPAAAPIIYSTFLVAVLLYLRVQRPASTDPRTQLHAAVAQLEEAVESDLQAGERDSLEAKLELVRDRATTPDQRRLADVLLGFVRSPELTIAPDRLTPRTRLVSWWSGRDRRILGHRGFRWLLSAALIVSGLRAIVTLVLIALVILYLVVPGNLSLLELNYMQMLVDALSGVLLVPGAILIALNRRGAGLRFVFFSLVLALVLADLLAFYLRQFDAIWTALFHLVLLLGLLIYQRTGSVAHPASVSDRAFVAAATAERGDIT